ncbi:ADP-ribose pyrophosphatase, mitochondrial [Dufourea novaeangliae]|uniref:ADP-ribose pyrophosphatase, mitochondrial n=2 Tax=Dufourea novaeangliae TaxID=178035 RepID=A0A154PDJ8_DUFNO|nr:ADP-ribose pyrophosphatase, mitochondrial [Dufourea novaeangliae]
MMHYKCRQSFYPSSNIKRFEVPENKVPWDIEYPEYKPAQHTASVLKDKPWADPEIGEPSFEPKWNSLDKNVNRKSFTEDYIINENGYPLNPVGRTGITGRGLLGRWGPNHAADSIVTRWKRLSSGALKVNECTNKPILQFVAIQRQDSGEWAIPGGMIDPGETVSATLKREFMEEAMNALEKDNTSREELERSLKEFFEKGEEIYEGYVDDPRNTDNAWMETVALNFHDEDGSIVGQITLIAGDDARNVKWLDIDGKLNLYANHSEFIKKTVQKRNAHW